MPTLLPVFKGPAQERKYNPSQLGGPTKPRCPDKDLRDLIQAFEFPGSTFPTLKVVKNPDGNLKLDPRDTENVKNYFALTFAHISSVPIHVVDVNWDGWDEICAETQRVTNAVRTRNPGDFLDDNQLEMEAAGIPTTRPRNGGEEEEEDDWHDDEDEPDEPPRVPRRPQTRILAGPAFTGTWDEFLAQPTLVTTATNTITFTTNPTATNWLPPGPDEEPNF